MGEVVDLDSRRLWSINGIAELLKVDWRTVKAALRELDPDGEIKGKPAWLPEKAIPQVCAHFYGSASPEDMDGFRTPKDRLDYIRSERELVALKTQARELVPVEDHRASLSRMVKSIVTALDTLPDRLERECALDPKTIVAVQRICDNTREELYKENAGPGD